MSSVQKLGVLVLFFTITAVDVGDRFFLRNLHNRYSIHILIRIAYKQCGVHLIAWRRKLLLVEKNASW